MRRVCVVLAGRACLFVYMAMYTDYGKLTLHGEATVDSADGCGSCLRSMRRRGARGCRW